VSSGGSASSYDNLDEPSTSPRHARLQPWLPQPRSSGVVRHTAAKVAGSGTDEAFEEPEERLTPGAPSGVDVSSGNTSVWRRPTLDGHFQVIPPTMIGVFDPTAQLSKFARQTSTRRTSPENFQRHSGNTAKVSATVPKEMIRFDGVRQTNRVRSNTGSVHESPPRTLADISQLLESTKTTGFKSDEPSKLATSEAPEIGEAVGEVADGGQSSTSSSSSSSSSSSDDEENKAECVKVDDEETVIRAEDQAPANDCERNQTPTTSASGSTQSSSDGSPAAVDVNGHKSEQAATNDEESSAQMSVTPSQADIPTGDHGADSPLPLPVLETTPEVNEASIQVSSDVDVQQPTDAKNEASSSTSSPSKSSCSSHDGQDGDFDEQPELRISATDRGTSHVVFARLKCTACMIITSLAVSVTKPSQ